MDQHHYSYPQEPYRPQHSPPQPQQPPKNHKRRWIIAASIIGAVVVAGAIGGALQEDELDGRQTDSSSSGASRSAAVTTTTPLSPTTTTNSGAVEREANRTACTNARLLAADILDGIMTYGEARDEAKEIYEMSILAAPVVNSAARAWLAAFTSADIPEFITATENFDSACHSVGW
jgi:hypothetical protein